MSRQWYQRKYVAVAVDKTDAPDTWSTPPKPKKTPGPVPTFKVGDLVVHKIQGAPWVARVVWVDLEDPHEVLQVNNILNLKTLEEVSLRGAWHMLDAVTPEELAHYTEEDFRAVLREREERVRAVGNRLHKLLTTVELDPHFTVYAHDLAVKVSKVGDYASELNKAEQLSKIYGPCYPNAHLRIQVQ